jgi:hypothetical protein
MTDRNRPLTLDFLAWLSESPRTYADAMDAWRTSCPRLAVWEDALADGLIRVDSGRSGPAGARPIVRLTPRGREALAARSPSAGRSPASDFGA